MRLATTFRQQLGATYDDLLHGALLAEALEFDAVYLPDHLMPTPEPGEAERDSIDDWQRPSGPSDAWALLAGLARETTTLRIGTLVTSSTFRHPAMTAATVADVAKMSDGRVDLGIGASWFTDEHVAYGIAHPPLAERFDNLAEQLEIIRLLWTTPPSETVSFTGRRYTLHEANPVAWPPLGGPPPVIIGGRGLRRTPALAARYADKCNAIGEQVEAVAPFFEACVQACEVLGRDPATLGRTVAMRVCCGEDDADLARIAKLAGTTLTAMRASIFVGTPDELVERLVDFDETGVGRVVLVRRLAIDERSLRLIGEEVVPRVHSDADSQDPPQ